MRCLAKDSKKITQSAPTMNSTTWNQWLSDFIRNISSTEDELQVRVLTKDSNIQDITRVSNTYSGLQNNHKYFVRMVIKRASGEDMPINRTQLGSTNIHSSKNFIGTATGANLTVYISNSRFNVNDEFKVKIEAFDLTADFGAGNEPTDVTFCQNYYGSAYIPNGTHYIHTDRHAMNGNTACTAVSDSTFDQNPYLFRQTQNTGSIDCWDKIVGGTINWNQLVQHLNVSGYSAGKWTYGNNSRVSVEKTENSIKCTVLENFTGSIGRVGASWNNYVSGHKYLVHAKVDESVTNDYSRRWTVAGRALWQRNLNTIVNCQTTISSSVLLEYAALEGNFLAGDVITISDVYAFDLTQMFGPTVADYIYSLQQATAGAGVAWFKNLFPKSYYAYNAGELMSVCTNAHITRGFNAWDEQWEVGSLDPTTGAKVATNDRIRSKNFIPVLPNTTYFVQGVPNYGNLLFVAYDQNKNVVEWSGNTSLVSNRTITTPDNAHYLMFRSGATYTTYNHDICINLSDSARNGEYEPYMEHLYPLSPVELRGIPKLDANNNLYFDGDIYEKIGKVTRRYGIADLGDLSWDTYTSGVLYMRVKDFAGEGAGKAKPVTVSSVIPNFIINGYVAESGNHRTQYKMDKTISLTTANHLLIRDSAYTDPVSFKAAMSGVYLIYELATPTTETANPFADPQIVDESGTEEYVDALATAETNPRDVAIPVGHKTVYF